MDVRPAGPDDVARIREVARLSFQSSFALSPEQIETIIEDVFADEALADRIDDPGRTVFVATDGGDVVGFVDAEPGGEGSLRWLHVDPDARGQGAGTALVERVREELTAEGSSLTARVLEEASEGGGFLERFGLHPDGTVRTEFGGERFFERVYTATGRDHPANEPAVEVPESVIAGGTDRPVDRDDPLPGTDAPFFPIFAGEARDERFGFFCSNCGSIDVSADGLDRLECGECGNRHLADEWDAAYL